MTAFKLSIIGLCLLTGCADQSEPSFLVKRTAEPIKVDASFDEPAWKTTHGVAIADEHTTDGYFYSLWDDRYLYLRVRCYRTDVHRESLRLRLQFQYREHAAPFDVEITTDGRCLDPTLSRARRVEMSPERVVCKTASTDKAWEAEIRVSLLAINAIENRITATVTLRGICGVGRKKGPTVFTGTRAGVLHFDYRLDRLPK